MKIEEKYVRIGERGQIVIPKRMREESKMKPGEMVKIVNEPNQIVIRKEQKVSGEELFFETLAKMKGKITMKDWDRIHKEREER
jgi:AbrB family looped-hinge helix DNA binding protein